MSPYSLQFRRGFSIVLCFVLLFLPSASLVFSQTPPPRQKTKKQVKVSISDLLVEPKGAVIATPIVAGYTANGKFVPDGPVQLKYANARAAVQGLYSAGKPQGTWRIFYPSGRLQSEVVYRAGKPNGLAHRYWEDGKVAREEEYASGNIKRWVIYDKKGRRISEFKKSNGQITYAYRLTKQGAIIVDARLKKVTFVGYAANVEKACRLRDNEDYRCKTPYQIWRDLNTFLEAEEVTEILEELVSKYDELGLEKEKGILTQCANSWVATHVSNGGAVVQESEFRAQTSDSEMTEIKNSCRDAQIAGVSGGGGRAGSEEPSGTDAAYQDQVTKTKSTMEGMLKACKESQQFDRSGGIQEGASPAPGDAGQAGTTSNPPAEAKEPSKGTADFTDDGWGPWQATTDPTTGKKTETRQARNSPTRQQTREESEGKTVITDVVNGQVTKVTTYLRQVDGSWERISKNYRTNTIERATKYKDFWHITSTKPIDPHRSMGDSLVPGIPCDECRAGNCAAMAAWWGRISTMCDRVGWQTYECSSIVRTFENCVDTAEILPGPDGDLTCSRQGLSDDEARALECKRRGMLESLGGPEDVASCNRAATLVGKLPSVVENICNDPRGHCLPDKMIDNGLLENPTREGLIIEQRPSRN